MVEIKWTNQSLYDIENIAEFISKDSIRYAKLQVERIFQCTEILKKQPLTGRLIPEIGDETIREVIQDSYRVIYRLVNEEQIDILTVHHGKRLLGNNPVFME